MPKVKGLDKNKLVTTKGRFGDLLRKALVTKPSKPAPKRS